MDGNSTERRWAPVRFHPSKPLDVPADVAERVRRIYALQADDADRFDAAATGLVARLDLGDGPVTAMTCDHRFSLLFENWAASCDAVGLDVRRSTIVFPTDRDAADRVESLGFVAYFDDRSELLAEMRPSDRYGDHVWADYMFHQNWTIRQLLTLGADVLFQDVDLVWRRDPRAALRDAALAGADIQAMYDGPNDRFQPLYANSGFMYFRNAGAVRDFWDEVYERHDMVALYHSQQEPLNVLLAAHAHRGLDVRILDEKRFANGHLYSGHRTAPPEPWVVHLSWTTDLADKLERCLDHGMWFLEETTAREIVEAAVETQRARREGRRRARAAAAAGPPGTQRRDEGPAAQQAIDELLQMLDRVRSDRDALATELASLRRSSSWRLTAPLRSVKAAWRHRRR